LSQPGGFLTDRLPRLVGLAPFRVKCRERLFTTREVRLGIVNPQVNVKGEHRFMAEHGIDAADQQEIDPPLIHRSENDFGVHITHWIIE
jgi:hypothetical protein